jgi:hypothetical protein
MVHPNCVNEDGSIDFDQLALNVATHYCTPLSNGIYLEDWDDSPFQRVMDWRRYVPSPVVEAWDALPAWLRAIFFVMAAHEEWD